MNENNRNNVVLPEPLLPTTQINFCNDNVASKGCSPTKTLCSPLYSLLRLLICKLGAIYITTSHISRQHSIGNPFKQSIRDNAAQTDYDDTNNDDIRTGHCLCI